MAKLDMIQIKYDKAHLRMPIVITYINITCSRDIT